MACQEDTRIEANPFFVPGDLCTRARPTSPFSPGSSSTASSAQEEHLTPTRVWTSPARQLWPFCKGISVRHGVEGTLAGAQGAQELPHLQGAAGWLLPPWAWVWYFPSCCTKQREGFRGCSRFTPGAGLLIAIVTQSPSLPHADLEEEFHQWDDLLEGIGDAVVPEAPFCRSNL